MNVLLRVDNNGLSLNTDMSPGEGKVKFILMSGSLLFMLLVRRYFDKLSTPATPQKLINTYCCDNNWASIASRMDVNCLRRSCFFANWPVREAILSSWSPTLLFADRATFAL